MEERDKLSKELKEAWHSDPNNWKWGVLYFNKEDKRLFPPKRINGMGWTVNFANPYSIISMLLILLVASAVVYYIGLKVK